jgi:AhpD family alkylhydroperoxidase
MPLSEQETIEPKGVLVMEAHIFPDLSKDLAQKRRELAPEIYGAFRAFGQRVFADGALPSKTKELIAIAVAHVTQCPYCIRGHTDLALKKGATEQEIMEAIWVAAEMRAGAAYAHSILAIDAMNKAEAKPGA